MLKCPNEARGMFVADCESDLFDSHVAFSKKMRGFLQASFGKQPCHADPHVLLEKVLEIGGAQVDFNRQIVNREQCSGFDQFDDLAQAGIMQCQACRTRDIQQYRQRDFSRSGRSFRIDSDLS